MAVDDWERLGVESTLERRSPYRHKDPGLQAQVFAIRSAFSYRLGASEQQLSRNEPGTHEQDQNSDRNQGDQGHTSGARELAANSCRSGATIGYVVMALRSGGHGRS